MRTLLARLLGRVVDVRADEARAMGLGFVFNFIVLGSYYVLRPIRDDIGAAGGVQNLSWLFLGTLVTMLAANAAFSAIVARLSRRRFIPIAYRFFIVNLALFYVLLRWGSQAGQAWTGRAFFVWVSVFNLFVVSVFWAFMTDVFNSEQAKRLFGFIAVGGTLGAIAGGAVTASLVQRVGAANLLLVSAVLLECGARCVRAFPAHFEGETAQQRDAEAPTGGTLWSGVVHAFGSPYLLGVSAFILLHAFIATLVYFQQADITAREFTDRAARTAFFARLDLSVNVLTVVAQVAVTGRLLKRFGVGPTLAMLPALSVAGFVTLALVPTLSLLAVFQVLRRAMDYAVSRPAREVLFTVLRREDKYKAKSFMDTFVYRTGDQVGAWTYPLLGWLGLGFTGVSWAAAPLAGIWCALSVWLGRRQAVLAKARSDGEATVAAAPY